MYAFSLFTGQFWISTPFIVCASYPDTLLNCCSHLLLDWIHRFSFPFSVDLLLKAVGDTPIMKQKKWAVERGRTVQSLSQFISRFLKLDTGEQLVRMKLAGFTKKQKIPSDHVTSVYFYFFTPQFIYVNQSFAPSPDQDVGVLFDVSTHSDLHLITRKWIGIRLNKACHALAARGRITREARAKFV